MAGGLIATAAGLAYLNSFKVPFVFDDNLSIRDNPSIRSLLTGWSPPAGGGLTVSGRPFLNFTLALSHAASGLEVWSYHLLNLLIHVAAGCALFGIVRRTLRWPGLAQRFGRDSAWLALAVALVWTLHPLQTESVTYIIQRAESLVSLCYLVTLWCFIRSVEEGAGKNWAWLAWVACLLGMAAKEVMVTAPVLVALYDRIFVTGSWRETWVRRGRFHLALASTWLLLAWLVATTSGRGGTAGFGTAVSPGAYALTQIGAVAHYLRLCLWPSPLVLDYGKGLAHGWSDVWWQALVLFPLGGASLWAAWRGRAAGFLGVFFFAVLAPSSSFVPVVTQTMSEHRVYLALAAVVALVIAAAYRAWGRTSLAGFMVIALVLGGATVRRNHDYRSEAAIWEDVVAKRPGNLRALEALGSVHLAAGRLEEALAVLREAVQLEPASAEAWNNLGNAWMKSGRWLEAITCFRRALVLQPNEPFALNNLGNAQLQVGEVPLALTKFEEALRAKPDFPEPRYNLATTLARDGRFAEAAPHYVELLRLKPDDSEARSNYATVLMELGRGPEAIAQMEIAVRLKPGSADLQNNLGTVLARSGRPAEAISRFREALRLQPDYAGARENLERATRALNAASREH